MEYYILNADYSLSGPFAPGCVMAMHSAGRISAETPAAVAGDSCWQPFADLLPVVSYEAALPDPAAAAGDFDTQIAAARNSGPPTPAVLMKLLEEERQFPRPRIRPVLPPPSSILINSRQRTVPLRNR